MRCAGGDVRSEIKRLKARLAGFKARCAVAKDSTVQREAQEACQRQGLGWLPDLLSEFRR